MSNVIQFPVRERWYSSVVSSPGYKEAQKKMNDLHARMLDNVQVAKKPKDK